MSVLSGPLPGSQKARTKTDFSLATVNIVLLLVFFFLITGTLVETDELAVDLARTEDLPLDRLPRPLLLMHPDGSWALDGEPVTPATLALTLNESFARIGNGNRQLHLLPDHRVGAQDLIGLLRQPDLADVQIKLVTLRIRADQ